MVSSSRRYTRGVTAAKPVIDGRVFLELLRRALIRSFRDDCFETAKGVAFSSILSFFPGLMVVAALLFSQNVAEMVQEISTALGTVLPPQAHRLVAQYLSPAGLRTKGLLAGAGVVAIWSASGAILSLMQGFRTVYRLPETRSFLRARGVALLLLLLAGVPLLFATLLLFFGQQIESWLMAHWGAGSWWILLAGRALRWIVALVTSTAVIGMVYRFAPNRPQRWRCAWPGAAVATALWLLATLTFVWYVRHVARYSDLYGSISAAVVLLLWMYIVSLAVLVGCEFNVAYEEFISTSAPVPVPASQDDSI